MRVCLHAHVVAVFWSQHFQTWLCLLHSASLRHQNLHMWVQSSARQSRSLLRSCWSTREIWFSGWIYVHTHTPGLHSLPSLASSFLTSGNRIFPGFPRCRGLGPAIAQSPRLPQMTNAQTSFASEWPFYGGADRNGPSPSDTSEPSRMERLRTSRSLHSLVTKRHLQGPAGLRGISDISAMPQMFRCLNKRGCRCPHRTDELFCLSQEKVSNDAII